MATTNQNILNKIGSILVDLSENYQSLLEDSSKGDNRLLYILQAQSKNLTVELELLEKLSNSAPSSTNKKVNSEPEEIIFTPPTPDLVADLDQPSLPVQAEEIIEEKQTESDNIPKNEDFVKFELEELDTEQESQEEEEVESLITENDESWEENDAEIEDYSTQEFIQQSPIEEPESVVENSEKPEEAKDEILDIQQDKSNEVYEKPQSVEVRNDVYTAPAIQEAEPVNADEAVVKEVVIEQKEVFVPVEPVVSEPVKPARPLTLNELIQQQKQAGVTNAQRFATSTSSTEKVTDLKSAINLNDKLLFIKDLFNGYSLAYSEAIELLNRFDNLSEADAFLQSNYAMKNGWSQKEQTVGKLYEILRKRFV